MSSVKIIQIIKRDLKTKGITYKEIAAFLKMTEAGVKKLLSKDDISFNKLKLICDLLQVCILFSLFNPLLRFPVPNYKCALVFHEKMIPFRASSRLFLRP